MIRLVGGHATDAGRVRTNNQDRIVAVDGLLYGVADGMGGHRGGEVAAEVVATGLREMTGRESHSALTTEIVTNEISELNDRVLTRANDDEDLYGMGTTLTAIALATTETPNGTEQVVSVFNVGDSRTYLLRNGELTQLTEDHSVVGDLIRAGKITPEEAKTHRQRSVVTRALGVDTTVEIDVLEVLPAPGMRYLMCSDGLTGEVPDELIGSILRRLANPAEAARELVRMAVERGGRDNVSVVVVDIIDETGIDHTALWASGHVDATANASATATATATAEVTAQKPTSESRDTQRTRTKNSPTQSNQPTESKQVPQPKVRKPFPVNLRVIAFLAVLAALAGVVFTVVKSAKDVVEPETNVTIATTASTELEIATTTITTNANSAPTVAPIPTPIPAQAETQETVAPATDIRGEVIPTPSTVPGETTTTTIDDFAQPKPTKAKKTTRAKKAAGKTGRTTK
jgi:PPM family protein phosphatase